MSSYLGIETSSIFRFVQANLRPSNGWRISRLVETRHGAAVKRKLAGTLAGLPSSKAAENGRVAALITEGWGLADVWPSAASMGSANM